MWPPPLFEERAQREQIALAIGGPILFGIIAGLLLGVSQGAYVVFSVIALVGMVLAGFEHLQPAEAALRGVAAGLLYGAFILATKAVAGIDPKAHLPSPEAVLVVLTVAFSVVGGAAGAALRRRRANQAPSR